MCSFDPPRSGFVLVTHLLGFVYALDLFFHSFANRLLLCLRGNMQLLQARVGPVCQKVFLRNVGSFLCSSKLVEKKLFSHLVAVVKGSDFLHLSEVIFRWREARDEIFFDEGIHPILKTYLPTLIEGRGKMFLHLWLIRRLVCVFRALFCLARVCLFGLYTTKHCMRRVVTVTLPG